MLLSVVGMSKAILVTFLYSTSRSEFIHIWSNFGEFTCGGSKFGEFSVFTANLGYIPTVKVNLWANESSQAIMPQYQAYHWDTQKPKRILIEGHIIHQPM